MAAEGAPKIGTRTAMRKEPKHPVDASFEEALGHRTAAPRSTSWEAVLSGQETPWSSEEEALIQNLKGHQVSPKSSSWDRIQAHLQPVKRRTLAWYRWTAAASVLLIATLAWWYDDGGTSVQPPNRMTQIAQAPKADATMEANTPAIPIKRNREVSQVTMDMKTSFTKMEPTINEAFSMEATGQERDKLSVQWMSLALEQIEEDLHFVAIPETLVESSQLPHAIPVNRRRNWLQPTSPWSKAITAYVATQSARVKEGQPLQMPWSNYTIAVEVKVPPMAHSFIQNTLTHP
jgi:hypothetical protein